MCLGTEKLRKRRRAGECGIELEKLKKGKGEPEKETPGEMETSRNG